MTQRDNWGWQARIGMFIVGSEVVPEAEWWAMVPLNVGEFQGSCRPYFVTICLLS